MATHQPITADQIERYREAFDLIDKKRTGIISSSNLMMLLKAIGKDSSEAECQSIINLLNNCNGNGTMLFSHFVRFIERRLPDDEEAAVLAETFSVLDRDGDGYIGAKDLKVTVASLGIVLSDAQISRMIEEVDTDGDGCIDSVKFLKLMKPN